MTVELLKARIEAHEQTEALGLLSAVRVIAKTGSHKPAAQWGKDWDGLRFYYGERCGNSDQPYAEVMAIKLSKDFPVHEKLQPGKPFFPNPDDAVTSTELLYEHTDLDGGMTRCFRPGPWVDKVLAEAKRLSALPIQPKAVEASPHFAAYEGK